MSQCSPTALSFTKSETYNIQLSAVSREYLQVKLIDLLYYVDVLWARFAIFIYGGVTHGETKEHMHKKLVDDLLKSLEVEILKIIQGNK